MDSGAISVADLSGGLDLQATLESGQTYLWWREDGRMFAEEDPSASDAWYRTTAHDPATGEPGVIRARQHDGHLEWESTVDAEPVLRRRLRLADDLPAIRAEAPADDILVRSYDAYWGMRLVDEPVFPTLVTFICSAQMRVERIHDMQQALRRSFGEPVSVQGELVPTYPTPEAVAASTETRLRDLGLGYRAPYVLATAEMIAGGDADPCSARDRPYEEAREYLTRFVGVGEKVADCVLLFALDFPEAVPLDTWIRKAIARWFPACDCGSYAATSAAIRERLGGDYAGYAQTYLFHYLRHVEEPAAVRE
ncbi:MAG: 8-oxoguanine DNA glycosylase [Haloarculaceae archaeon]